MFDKFLEENEYRREYYEELCNYIEKHANGTRPLIAVHGLCTDGGTAGAMIHHNMPEAIIIPLDYKILNHPSAAGVLENIKWYGIVDLKPFNNHPVEFWVDHHRSAMNTVVNARKIRFDENGDSGSYQLFLSDFIGELPQHLIELAVMTRTTDTANYITEPPTEMYNSLKELVITETSGTEGRKQNEKRIWLLDDAWGSVRTLKDQLQLYDYLAKDGFMGIEKVLPRINELRKGRYEAVEIANNMNRNADIVCYSFLADTIDNFTITRKLQVLGVKVVISMAVVPDGVKLSLRRNRNLTPEENEILQLNELASQMNGGGHAGASGGKATSINEAMEIITNWAENIQLKVALNDLMIQN